MAIKLEIYLKRTGQTLESWLDANGVTRPEEFLPRCAYIGLAAGAIDQTLVADIFKKRKQAAKQAEPEPQVEVRVKPPKKKTGPATIDESEPA